MISTLESHIEALPRTIHQIETLAARYDAGCAKLESMLQTLEADIDAVKQKHLRHLKRQAAIVATRQADLHAAVEESPALFTKPRSLTLHGTKFGFARSEGRVEWDDDEQVVRRVQRHFSGRFAELVRTEYTPRKDALRNLGENELATLGCRIIGAGDASFVKRMTGDVEKTVNNLTGKHASSMIAKE